MPDMMNLDNEIIERRDKYDKERGKYNKPYEKPCQECHKPSPEPKPDKCGCCGKNICNVIESIADEEMSIACLLSAECEKIKKAVHLACDINELVLINDSVNSNLKNIIKLQLVLQLKLEEANEMLK